MATATHRSKTDHRIFEQSTANIWSSLATSCKRILEESKIDPSLVKGVGFDATCSLAVINKSGESVNISRSKPGEAGAKESDEYLGQVVSGGKDAWDVILWADHRAEQEAETINATGEGVLGFVGKTMSVSPGFGLNDGVVKTKIGEGEGTVETRYGHNDPLGLVLTCGSWKWRSQKPFGSTSTWRRTDSKTACSSSELRSCFPSTLAELCSLPDYLTYRATTSTARSTCSLACKCSYVPPGATMTHDCDGGEEEVSKDGWSARFFKKIGRFGLQLFNSNL